MDKHKNHNKRRLYIRNQSSGAKQWEATDYYVCECGAVLEKKWKKKK